MEKSLQIGINAEISRIDRNTGKVLDVEKLHNIVVDAGLERIARRLFDNTTAPHDHIAIGTGVVAEASGDIALGTEVKRALAGTVYTIPFKATYTKVFTFGSGEVFNITEAGIFDSLVASGSTMFDRLVFAPKSVDLNTSLSVTIEITVGRV